MANTKISNLTASASNLAASDLVPVVQTPGVGPVKMTGTQIKTGIIGAGSVSIASGKTFTSSNTLTLAGTDSTTMTFPSTSATIARTDAGNTFTGAQTFSVGTVNGTGLDISQTWTGTGTYTGLKYNVGTDSGPANAASLLLDLQVGAVSKLNVRKSGTITSGVASGSQILIGTYASINQGTNTGFYFTKETGGTQTFGIAPYDTVPSIKLPNTGAFYWASSTNLDLANNNQTTLTSPTTATLQLGAADAAAPVAQFFKVQGVVSGTSNTAGANFTIQGSQGTGTGAGGSIIFQVAPAGSSGTAQNAYATALAIASNRNASFSGDVLPASDNGPSVGSNSFRFNTGFFATRVSVGASATVDWNGDTFLFRDAANTLALRNGTSAQQLNVYKTYTDGSNYSRLSIGLTADANTHYLYVEQAGTGAARDLLVGTSGAKNILFYTSAISRWFIDNNGHLLAGAVGAGDNTYDIGASGANRPRNIYAGTSIIAGSGGTIGFQSRAAINSGSDGVLVLYNWAGSDFGRLQFGGTTSSFPALKRSTTTLQVRLADDSAYSPIEASTVRTATAYTVATLPAAGTAGRRAYVTDATAPTYLGALIGGGTVVCPVFDNGTAWVSA